MPMLSELESFKAKILNMIIRDPECVELISCKKGMKLPAAELVNDNIYMYDYIDDTVKDQKVFVCIEIDEGEIGNIVSRYFDIHIYVVVHKSLMDYVDDDGRGGVRRDAICSRIDHLLNGSPDFGFGKLEASYGGRIVFSNDFRAKDLHYRALGKNLWGEGLDRQEQFRPD